MRILCRFARRLELKKAFILLIISLPFMLLLAKPGPESAGYMFIGEIIDKYFPTPWVSLIANSILLLILLKFMHSRRPDMNFRKMIRDVLGGNIGTVFGLTVLILELVLIGWITDYLREGIYWAAASSALMFFNILMLFMLMTSVPKLSRRHVKQVPEKKKVLVFALSIKRKGGNETLEEFKNRVYKEYEKEIQSLIDYYLLKTTAQKPGWSNWEPPIRTIAHHLDTAEKVLVLTSKTTENQLGTEELFKNIFKPKVQKAIKSLNKCVKLIEIGPVDFNDYNEILDCVKNALKKVFQEGYTDRDLSFMISGGTSAVTAALIISAVRDGRQVEYFTQDNKSEHISIDVNVLHVQRLFGGELD